MKKIIVGGAALCVCLLLILGTQKLVGQKSTGPIKRTLTTEQLKKVAQAIEALKPKPKMGSIPKPKSATVPMGTGGATVGSNVGGIIRTTTAVRTNPTLPQIKNARRSSGPSLTLGQQVIIKAPRAGDDYLPITTADDYNFGNVASAEIDVYGRNGYDIQLSSSTADVYNFVSKDIGVL